MNKDNSKYANDLEEGIYNAPMILSDKLDVGIEKTKKMLNNYINSAYICIENFEESIYKKALFELLELIRNV